MPACCWFAANPAWPRSTEMASPTQTTAQQQQVRDTGLIGKTISLPFAFFGIMLASLGVSILTEWIGITFFWPELGWRHSQGMLNDELGWINDNVVRSLVLEQPGKTARYLINLGYEWLFEKTGLIDWIRESAARSRHDALHAQGIHAWLGWLYVHIEDYGLAVVYTTLTFLARLVVLTLSIPLFLMAAFTGLVEGLVRRDLRRFGAGRESGFIYHRAKRLIVPLSVAPWIIYLALPVSWPPVLVLLPCAAALGMAVSITAGSFKKYL